MTDQESQQTTKANDFKARGKKTGLLNGNTPGVKAIFADLLVKHAAIDPTEARNAISGFYQVGEEEAERAMQRCVTVLHREGKAKREGKVIKRGENFDYLRALAAGWLVERAHLAEARGISEVEADRLIIADRERASILGQPGKLRKEEAAHEAPQGEAQPAAPAEAPAQPSPEEAERAAKRAAFRAKTGKGKESEPDASALKAPPKRPSKKEASEADLKAKAEELRAKKAAKDAEAAQKAAEKKAKQAEAKAKLAAQQAAPAQE